MENKITIRKKLGSSNITNKRQKLSVAKNCAATSYFYVYFTQAAMATIASSRIVICINSDYLMITIPDLDTKKHRNIFIDGYNNGWTRIGDSFHEDIEGEYIFDEEENGKFYFNKI